MMNKVIDQDRLNPISPLSSSSNDTSSSRLQKRKRFGEDYETGNLSDEYDTDDDEELDRYLCKRLDATIFPDNPLEFRKNYKTEFPTLAKVARQIFSISATKASAERSFSAAGNIVAKRRTIFFFCDLFIQIELMFIHVYINDHVYESCFTNMIVFIFILFVKII